MYRSAYIVLFVNTDDCFRAVSALLSENIGREILLPISYDSDIYALEEVAGYMKKWSDYLETLENDRLTVEIRTKCGTSGFLDNISERASKNVVLTWSVNPESVIKAFEKRTSPLDDRLNAIKKAVSRGFKVRVAIDPVIAAENTLAEYIKLVRGLNEVATKFDAVSVGMFRIPPDFLKIMRKNAPKSAIAWDYYQTENNVTTYGINKRKIYIETIKSELIKIGIPENKIFVRED